MLISAALQSVVRYGPVIEEMRTTCHFCELRGCYARRLIGQIPIVRIREYRTTLFHIQPEPYRSSQAQPVTGLLECRLDVLRPFLLDFRSHHLIEGRFL